MLAANRVDDNEMQALRRAQDPFGGMTSKMAKFVDLSFSGLSDIEAYRQSYDISGMTARTVAVRAHEVAHHPLVTVKLRELQEAREAQAILVARLGKEYVLEGIMKIAERGDKDSTRLRAFELLGKTAGIDLFRETTRVEHVNRTPEDVERELKAKLSEMMKTIEGSARPALEPGAAAPAAPATKPAPADSAPRADRRRKPAPRS